MQADYSPLYSEVFTSTEPVLHGQSLNRCFKISSVEDAWM